jgi:chloride channel 2
LTVLASTLPVPSGSLIPIFKIGAAFGRIIGEAMNLWFPEGLRIGLEVASILPGIFPFSFIIRTDLNHPVV